MLHMGRLRVLHLVATSGSLTAAAAALNYTTSAVSQQISLLERETGTRLLDRHPRGVRLTEPGRVLAEHAGRILSDLHTAEATLTAVARGQAGRLRFGSFRTANATLMPRAVAAFQRSHPQVSLELSEIDRDEGLAAVASHELDLALVYEFPSTPIAAAVAAADVKTVPLLADPLHIMLARPHPLAGRQQLRLVDLADEHWIQGARNGSTSTVLPLACRAAGFEPNILFRTDDQMTVRGLVAAGIGVALAPWLTLATLPAEVVARPLDEPALIRTVLAAFPAARHRIPAAEDMGAALRQVSSELGPAPA
jgi:DNA-binding transcriptional LysR family regulator